MHTSDFAPYKGARSYEPEDYDLFFGREHEARAVSNLVLSSRVTVLCAPSGAGKTSLLNARVIPVLESAGWLPIRVRVRENPMRATREAVLLNWLVQPDLERAALRRATKVLTAGHGGTTLDDVLDRFASLHASDPIKRVLVAPRVASLQQGGRTIATHPDVTPFFCRLLRGTLSVPRYAEHIGLGTRPDDAQDGAFPLQALKQYFSSQPFINRCRQSVADAVVPAPDMLHFFSRLWNSSASSTGFTGIVVLFDQFEELFTMFRDPGGDLRARRRTQDWRLRWQFFEEFAALYRARVVPPSSREDDTGCATSFLPLRFVFSLREEFLGRLGPLREIVESLDEYIYRLEWLSEASAQQAIRQPARLYGYDYADDCFRRIVEALRREDRFVEPPHVQIVCDQLWKAYGKSLAAPADVARVDTRLEALVGAGAAIGPSQQRPEITTEQFEMEQGGAPGILRSYFTHCLEEFEAEGTLTEALEMLSTLITSGGTRNIVEHDALVQAMLRDPTRRAHVLEQLEAQKIVRVEQRLGGRFVEVAHEFLVDPILEAHNRLLTANPLYQTLVRATRTVERCLRDDFRNDPRALPTSFELDQLHDSRPHLPWSAESIELVVRACIVHGGDRSAFAAWLKDYRSLDDPDGVQETTEPAPCAPSGETVTHPRRATSSELVLTYLSSKQPQVRRNAASALAVVGTVASVQRLALLALEDEDADVRAHAARELVHAPHAHEATDVLESRLSDWRHASWAYALLGRLRSPGPARGAVHASSFGRRLAVDVASAVWRPHHARPSRRRALPLVLISGVAGASVMISFLSLLLGRGALSADVGLSVFFGATITGPLLGWTGMRKARPLLSRYDWLAAFLSELVWAVVAVLSAAVPLGLMVAAIGTVENPGAGFRSLFLLFIAQSAVVVVFARLSAMMGTSVPRAWAAVTLSWMLSGLLTALGLSVLLRTVLPMLDEVTAVAARVFWLLQLAAGFAVGVAYAQADLVAADRRTPREGRLAAIAALVTGALAAIVQLGPGSGESRRLSADEVVSAPSADEKAHTFPITSLPFTIRIQVGVPQTIEAETQHVQNPDFVLQLYGVSAGGRRLIKDWDDPPDMEYSAKPGTYELDVTTYLSTQRGPWVPSNIYLALLGEEIETPSPNPEEMTAARSHSVTVVTGLPHRRSEPEATTVVGVLRPGSRVRVAQPADLAEGPAWATGMDAAASSSMTVETIEKKEGYVAFRVAENSWWWDTRWVVEISAAPNQTVP